VNPIELRAVLNPLLVALVDANLLEDFSPFTQILSMELLVVRCVLLNNGFFSQISY
jgi:hypothetical protein